MMARAWWGVRSRGTRRIGWVLALPLCLLACSATAYAITTISEGFTTSDTLPIGSIVSLKAGTTDQVVAGNGENVNSILGAVVNDASVELATGKMKPADAAAAVQAAWQRANSTN